jgi:hypothetical protein
LADVQHEIWSHWMRYLFSVCVPATDGTVRIPVRFVERWQRQAEMPYSELTETEKDSDREQADKILAALQGAHRIG